MLKRFNGLRPVDHVKKFQTCGITNTDFINNLSYKKDSRLLSVSKKHNINVLTEFSVSFASFLS